MSTWRDRLGPDIQLNSPSGQHFRAYWRGGSRSVKKKLGVFSYPKVRGADVQDLDVEGDEYPIAFMFEGPDHDRDANRFWRACKERGPWVIDHPRWGYKTLQLVSVNEEYQAVESANTTSINSEWIEPMGNDAPVAEAAVESEVDQTIMDCNEASGETFIELMDHPQPPPGKLAVLKASIQRFRTNLAVARSAVTGISAAITPVRDQILQTVQSLFTDMASFSGAVQNLVTTPGLIIDDLSARFDYYESIIADSVLLNPPMPTPEGLAGVALHELIGTAALTALARSIRDHEFTTREEALAYSARFHAAYRTLQANLDAVQALYAGQPIERQFIAQASVYGDIARLVQSVTDMQLRRSFDLSVAKRITLTTNRTPVEIAITEDVDLDQFIAANHLQSDDVLILRAGREVVVYL